MASRPEDVVRFINMMLNDVIFCLDDAILKLQVPLPSLSPPSFFYFFSPVPTTTRCGLPVMDLAR